MPDRPGTFTDYHFNSGKLDQLEIYLTWESAPPSGFIYPAFNFSFEILDDGSAGGYIGIQLVGQRRTAIFSIWDLPDEPGTAKAVVQHGDRFANEGTGAKCLIDFPWQVQREFLLHVKQASTDEIGAIWEGTIRDMTTNDSKQIGLIRLSHRGALVGYGRLRPCAYTFVEYFAGPGTCDGQPYSRVRWRGPFASGVDASQAKIAPYPQCERNNVTSPERGVVIHETGGAVVRSTPACCQLW